MSKPYIRKFNLGDSIWRFHRGVLSGRKVIGMGRLYAYTDQGEKVRLDLMRDEFGDSYYVSQDEYDRAIALNKAWDDMRRVIENRYNPPAHVTLADIYRIIKIVQEPSK